MHFLIFDFFYLYLLAAWRQQPPVGNILAQLDTLASAFTSIANPQPPAPAQPTPPTQQDPGPSRIPTAPAPAPGPPLVQAPQESLQASVGGLGDGSLGAAHQEIEAIAADLGAAESPTNSDLEERMSPLCLQVEIPNKGPLQLPADAGVEPEREVEIEAELELGQEPPLPPANTPLAGASLVPLLPPLSAILPKLSPEKARSTGLRNGARRATEPAAGGSNGEDSGFHSSDIEQLPITQPIPYGGTPPDAGQYRPSSDTSKDDQGSEGDGGLQGGNKGSADGLNLDISGAKQTENGKNRVGGWLGAFGKRFLNLKTPGSAATSTDMNTTQASAQQKEKEQHREKNRVTQEVMPEPSVQAAAPMQEQFPIAVPATQEDVMIEEEEESQENGSVEEIEIFESPMPMPMPDLLAQPLSAILPRLTPPSSGNAVDALLPTQAIPASQAIFENDEEEEEEEERDFLDEMLEKGDRDRDDDAIMIEEIIEEVVQGERMEIESDDHDQNEQALVEELLLPASAEILLNAGGDFGAEPEVQAREDPLGIETALFAGNPSLPIGGGNGRMPYSPRDPRIRRDQHLATSIDARLDVGGGMDSPGAGGEEGAASPMRRALNFEQPSSVEAILQDEVVDNGGADNNNREQRQVVGGGTFPRGVPQNPAASSVAQNGNNMNTNNQAVGRNDDNNNIAGNNDFSMRVSAWGAGSLSLGGGGGPLTQDFNLIFTQEDNYLGTTGPIGGGGEGGGGLLGAGDSEAAVAHGVENRIGSSPILNGAGAAGGIDSRIAGGGISYGGGPIVDESPKPGNAAHNNLQKNIADNGDVLREGESPQPAEASRGPGNATLRGRALSREGGLAQTQAMEYTMQEQDEGADVQTSPIRALDGIVPGESSPRRPREEPVPLPGVSGMEYIKRRKLNPTKLAGNKPSIAASGKAKPGIGGVVPGLPHPQREVAMLQQRAERDDSSRGTGKKAPPPRVNGNNSNQTQQQQKRQLPPFPDLEPNMNSRGASLAGLLGKPAAVHAVAPHVPSRGVNMVVQPLVATPADQVPTRTLAAREKLKQLRKNVHNLQQQQVPNGKAAAAGVARVAGAGVVLPPAAASALGAGNENGKKAYANGRVNTAAGDISHPSMGIPAAAGFGRMASAPAPHAPPAMPYHIHNQPRAQPKSRLHPLVQMALSSHRHQSRNLVSSGVGTPADSRNGRILGAPLGEGGLVRALGGVTRLGAGAEARPSSREQPPPPLPMPQAGTYPSNGGYLWNRNDRPIAGTGELWQRLQQRQQPQEQERVSRRPPGGGSSELSLSNLLGFGSKR